MNGTADIAEPPNVAFHACWCGNRALKPFNDGYARCTACETLVSQRPAAAGKLSADTPEGIYGRAYFERHYLQQSNVSSIVERLRLDLRERNLYWLRFLLQYKLPGASVLEVGCGHGGFVAVLRLAGFEATGVELSPWLTELAAERFGLAIAPGRIEEQAIAPCSLDAIVLMDVLEHLPAPEKTLGHCASLLKPDGIVMIQTPCYPESLDEHEVLKRTPPFAGQLMPDEHVFIFSKPALTMLMHRAGLPELRFEPAVFGHYDMFAFGARQSLSPHDAETIGTALAQGTAGWITQLILDLDGARTELQQQCAKLTADVAYLEHRVIRAEQHDSGAPADVSRLNKIRHKLKAAFCRQAHEHTDTEQ